MHLHCAQVPPPPQAEDRKIFCAASVCSSLPPAGVVMVRSPLILILTSPLETSLERANKMMPTSASTMAVNITTLSRMEPIIAALPKMT